MPWTLSTALLFAALLLPDTSFAGDDEAEVQRVATEIRSQAQKNDNHGINKNYRKLLRIQADLPADVHFLAAKASKNVGDVLSAVQRLERAVEAQPQNEEAQRELADIHAQYTTVSLEFRGRGSPDLHPSEIPFRPDLQKAITFAQESAKSDRSLTVMLPVASDTYSGNYTFGDQSFSLQAGTNARVSANPGPTTETSLLATALSYGDFEWGPTGSVTLALLTSPAPRTPKLSSYGGEDAGFVPGLNGLAGGLSLGVEFSNRRLGVAAAVEGVWGGPHYRARYSAQIGPVYYIQEKLRVSPSLEYFVAIGRSESTISTQPAYPPDDQDSGDQDISTRHFGLGAALDIGYEVADFGPVRGLVSLDTSLGRDNARTHMGLGLSFRVVPSR